MVTRWRVIHRGVTDDSRDFDRQLEADGLRDGDEGERGVGRGRG